MNSALHPTGDLRKISKTINSCHLVWYVQQSIWRLKRTLHNLSGQLQRGLFLCKNIVNSFKPSYQSYSNNIEYLDFIKNKYFYLFKDIRIFLHEFFFSNAIQRYFFQQNSPDEFVFNNESFTTTISFQSHYLNSQSFNRINCNAFSRIALL